MIYCLGGTYSADIASCKRLWYGLFGNCAVYLSWPGGLDKRRRIESIWATQGEIIAGLQRANAVAICGFSHGGNVAVSVLSYLFKVKHPRVMGASVIRLVCAATPALREYNGDYKRLLKVKHAGFKWLWLFDRADPIIALSEGMEGGSRMFAGANEEIGTLKRISIHTGLSGSARHDALLTVDRARILISQFIDGCWPR